MAMQYSKKNKKNKICRISVRAINVNCNAQKPKYEYSLVRIASK